MTDIDQIAANFNSHHIEGYAREGMHRQDGGHFSVPLISHVSGPLWQGGCIDGVELPHDFTHVISLYPWEQYGLGPNTSRVEYELFDAQEVPAQVDAIAETVLDCCALPDAKVLVHCQAGLNRSGLVAGLAMVKAGTLPRDAIALLRAKRCSTVLCNRAFEDYLLAQHDELDD